jgi:hypothetical protein
MRRIATAARELGDERLAGADLLGVGLELRRVALGAGAPSTGIEAASGERVLYVIRGDGTAVVGGETFALDHESVLWLEPEDAPALTAGPRGLEVLIARAPL